MAVFDAGQETLSYDFTKYQEGVQGTIPEPSSEQIEVFTLVLRRIMPVKVDTDAQGVETHTLDLDEINKKFEGEGAADVEALINAAVAAVCSSTPTAEQIRLLPYRVKQRFYGWIVGTFLSPEA